MENKKSYFDYQVKFICSKSLIILDYKENLLNYMHEHRTTQILLFSKKFRYLFDLMYHHNMKSQASNKSIFRVGLLFENGSPIFYIKFY